jgi:hypothetical protein
MKDSKWQGRKILNEGHGADLEAAAAALEFGATRVPRPDAEKAVYEAYKRKQHGEAIAHHTRALRAAMASGLSEDAEKHAALYGLHMRALGMNPNSTPPPSLVGDSAHEKGAEFKNHDADQLLFESAMSKSERDAFFKHVDSDVPYLSEPQDNLEKGIRVPPSIEDLHGQRVRVYFNLHNRLFSIQHKGRVVAHLPEVSLKDVAFKVNEAGRQRVLQQQRKNVHAYVEGTFDHKPDGHQLLPQGVTYNPYKYSSFVRAHDKSPIQGAKAAVLKNLPHPTITVHEEPQAHAEPSWAHGKGTE